MHEEGYMGADWKTTSHASYRRMADAETEEKTVSVTHGDDRKELAG